MSGSSDNLKNMFDEAFAAEQIPFNMGAWNQMETLLNQKGAKIGFWIWFPGVLLIGALGSWFAFSNTQGELYNPRLASIEMESMGLVPSCDNIDDVSYSGKTYSSAIASIEPADSKRNTSSLGSTIDSPKSSIGAASNSPEKNNNNTTKSSPAITSAVPSQNTTSTAGTSIASNAGTDSGVLQSIVVDNSSSTEDATENRGDLGIANTDSKEMIRDTFKFHGSLDYMPILPLSQQNTNDPVKHSDAEFVSNNSFIPSFYVRAGVNKSFSGSLQQYPGIGQFAGIGYMHQIKPHLFINGELNGGLLRVNDTAQIEGVQAYGFQQFENEYLASTTELVRFNASVLAHYRIKRLYVGAGIQPWMLGALKNSTDHLVGKNDLMISYDESDGYFQWDRYSRFGASALLDAQYQITNDVFFGIRGAYDLTNNLNIEYRALRLLEIQAYLKLNLR
jgi:hypothetical protein